ncbi:hypothetical protein [Caloranaerobacter sp. DY30410]|uniref:hypothetical protein n=1 Tax=Caloranaerobacter sp. DY30410 TaxID=3238305 RepID=UPI003D0034B1
MIEKVSLAKAFVSGLYGGIPIWNLSWISAHTISILPLIPTSIRPVVKVTSSKPNSFNFLAIVSPNSGKSFTACGKSIDEPPILMPSKKPLLKLIVPIP